MRVRFTIRDLLWPAVVAAVCVAWWVDRCRLNSALELERNAVLLKHVDHPPAARNRLIEILARSSNRVVSRRSARMNSIS